MQKCSYSFMLRVTITFFIEYTISRNKFIQHFPKAMSAVVQPVNLQRIRRKMRLPVFFSFCVAGNLLT